MQKLGDVYFQPRRVHDHHVPSQGTYPLPLAFNIIAPLASFFHMLEHSTLHYIPHAYAQVAAPKLGFRSVCYNGQNGRAQFTSLTCFTLRLHTRGTRSPTMGQYLLPVPRRVVNIHRSCRPYVSKHAQVNTVLHRSIYGLILAFQTDYCCSHSGKNGVAPGVLMIQWDQCFLFRLPFYVVFPSRAVYQAGYLYFLWLLFFVP